MLPRKELPRKNRCVVKTGLFKQLLQWTVSDGLKSLYNGTRHVKGRDILQLSFILEIGDWMN